MKHFYTFCADESLVPIKTFETYNKMIRWANKVYKFIVPKGHFVKHVKNRIRYIGQIKKTKYGIKIHFKK